MDYRDQTAAPEGQLRISDTNGRNQERDAQFTGTGADSGWFNTYSGSVEGRGDTVRFSLFCDRCRVNAALGPVTRVSMWSALYHARALGGDRFELRQIPDAGDPPTPLPTVDTLIRLDR